MLWLACLPACKRTSSTLGSSRFGKSDRGCCCWRLQGWFDDRVEARNALAKVGKLWQIAGFDRADLPWMDTGDREGRMFESQPA